MTPIIPAAAGPLVAIAGPTVFALCVRNAFSQWADHVRLTGEVEAATIMLDEALKRTGLERQQATHFMVTLCEMLAVSSDPAEQALLMDAYRKVAADSERKIRALGAPALTEVNTILQSGKGLQSGKLLGG